MDLVLTSIPVSQAPLTNVLISLAFGVGQVIICLGMVIYSTRKGRWRQMGYVGLALIGTLIGCSGITELIVSSTELLAQTSSIITATTATQIRGLADHTLAIAAILVVLLAIFYPALMRLMGKRRNPRTSSIDTGPGEDQNPDTASLHVAPEREN